MERNAVDLRDTACQCCGVMVPGSWADDVGELCEWCCPGPGGRACQGYHADGLRILLANAVAEGCIPPWHAVAQMAVDDARWAGELEWRADDDGDPGGPGRWRIRRPSPDATAWNRLQRMALVNGTIQRVVQEFLGRAPGSDVAAECSGLLRRELGKLSTSIGCRGIWRVEVGDRLTFEIQPPTSYIEVDTVETRRRITIDHLVREAAAN